MFKFNRGNWRNVSNLSASPFICWNCGRGVASEKAFYSSFEYDTKKSSFIFICPNCNAPTIVDDGNKNVLLPLPGIEINKLPENIKILYSEIRKCIQSGCFNGAIILMRKLIMHIAVEEGDKVGKTFEQYIDFLCNNGIVPKKSKNKADSVRRLGNSANHEIENRTPGEAQACFEFIELLLKVNYEFAEEDEK
jgi:hypothetical protein